MRSPIVAFVLALCVAPAAHAGKEYSCNMAVFTREQMAHYLELSHNVFAAVQERKELKSGYAFRLPPEELVNVSQWIFYERRCCPFFKFDLEVAQDSGPLWLRITGDKGVKQFIQTELNL